MTPDSQPPTPGTLEGTPYRIVPVDVLESIAARCDLAMRGIPLGDARLHLDDAYLHVCVAWAYARHALRGTRPAAGQPISDLRPTPVSQDIRDHTGEAA